MNKALCCNGVLLLLCCSPLNAQEHVSVPPSVAFLEYLADMEEVDGKLYGPQDMQLETCQRTILDQEKKHNEIKTEINGIQNEKPPKNEDQAIKQECKNHD
jgi:hypothetical protein